uniref:Uncharacterized protein n=1 Tax=Anguilla anguilla TaxID=7936 RepID=A0A0E9WE48_ANGAN
MFSICNENSDSQSYEEVLPQSVSQADVIGLSLMPLVVVIYCSVYLSVDIHEVHPPPLPFQQGGDQ